MFPTAISSYKANSCHLGHDLSLLSIQQHEYLQEVSHELEIGAVSTSLFEQLEITLLLQISSTLYVRDYLSLAATSRKVRRVLHQDSNSTPPSKKDRATPSSFPIRLRFNAYKNSMLAIGRQGGYLFSQDNSSQLESYNPNQKKRNQLCSRITLDRRDCEGPRALEVLKFLGDQHLDIEILSKTTTFLKGGLPGSSLDNLFVECACENGREDILKQLLLDPSVNPGFNYSVAISLACEFNHLPCLQLLLNDERSDPTAFESDSLKISCELGHFEIVKFLLLQDGRARPGDDDNYCLKMSAQNGHDKVVELLLLFKRNGEEEEEDVAKVNVKAEDSFGLRAACKNGHLTIVKLLLPPSSIFDKEKDSDPMALEGEAFLTAIEGGHLTVAEYLLLHPAFEGSPSLFEEAFHLLDDLDDDSNNWFRQFLLEQSSIS